MKYPAAFALKKSALCFIVPSSLCPFAAYAEPAYFSLNGGLISQDNYFVASEDQSNNFTLVFIDMLRQNLACCLVTLGMRLIRWGFR